MWEGWNNQNEMKRFDGGLKDRIIRNALEGKDLEFDLKLNASMLAKQCDLAREAEAEREHLSKLLIEERIKVLKMRDAINTHEKFKRTHNTIVALEDEELYQTKKEVETS